MTKNRKSQVAIFIILAMFILIAFLFVYNLRRTLSTTLGDSDVEEHLMLPDKNFEEFFEACVQQETEYYVDAIMKQGGYIYIDQGGTVKRDLSNIPFSNRISVGVTDIFGNTTSINYGITDYVESSYVVSKNFKGTYAASSLDLYSGNVPVGLFNKYSEFPFFGTNALPKLCNRDGPNAPNSSIAYTCNPLLYNKGNNDKEFTIQSQLNQVLSTAISDCYEKESVINLYDVSYIGDGSVSITLGDDDIAFDANITLSYGKNNDVQTFDVSYIFPIRLKKLYTLGYLIVERDVKEIHFDKRTEYKDFYSCNGNCWDTYIELEQKRDFLNKSEFSFSNINYDYDDLIILKDRKTILTNNLFLTNVSNTPFNEDEQMTLIFMVQNRRPYLEEIPDLPLVSRNVFSDQNVASNKRKVYFNIKVLDPDDGDAIDIYNRTNYGLLNLTSSSAKYREVGTYILSEDTTLNPFSSFVVPKTENELTYNITLSCGDDTSTNQCHECTTSGCYFQKDYYDTYYVLNITAKDSGNLFDEQLFNLTVEYR